MSVNKMADARDISVTSKNELDDPQQKDSDNNRRNAGGYSWWKWRRSTESAEKKSPPKEIQDSKESRQSVERVDEMKEIMNDLDNMTISGSTAPESKAADDQVELQDTSLQNPSVDNTDSGAKNDDSISSELADVSKSSFSSEKYRKTLRLTSEQIVSSWHSMHKSCVGDFNLF